MILQCDLNRILMLKGCFFNAKRIYVLFRDATKLANSDSAFRISPHIQYAILSPVSGNSKLIQKNARTKIQSHAHPRRN